MAAAKANDARERGEPNPVALEFYQKAETFRKEGRNNEALTAAKQSIRFDSECGKCFGLLSAIEGNLGLNKDGVANAHTGILKSHAPRDKAMSAYNMGFNLGGLGKNSEAVSAYADCKRFDASFSMCYFGMGKTLVELHDYRQALDTLQQATSLQPKHGPSWAYKAFAEGGLGKMDSSLISSTTAVLLSPTDPRSYLARAYARGLNSRFEEMLADIDRTLELDSQRPFAHLLRGQALTLLGRKEEAAREFDLEVDRKAVAKALHPEQQVDLRIYNCGDPSTDIQTPDNFNVDDFKDCQDRAMKALMETAVPAAPKPAPKPKWSIPGLPQPKARNK